MPSRFLQGCDSKHPRVSPQQDCFPSQSPRARQPTHASSASQNALGVLSPPLTPENSHHSNKPQNEHVESGSYGHYPQSTNEDARRGIMPASPSQNSPSTRPLFTFPVISATEFTFRISPRPDAPLSFSREPSPSSRSWKRRRAVADIDGEHSCLHKKKRRLRLFLITSRLSPQFSHPATNIVDRGSSKIAVWAKQRALGRNILRKAAILNCIRRQSIYALETAGGLGRVLVEQEKEQEQLQLARLTLMYGSHDSATQPVIKNGNVGLPEGLETRSGENRHSDASSPASAMGTPPPSLRACDAKHVDGYRSPNEAYAYSHAYPRSPRPAHLPLPPSPLGLSNYDALDSEDDFPDPYAHLDEEYGVDEQNEHVLENDFTSRPLSTRRSGVEASRGSEQQAYSEFSFFDPGEPVMGDYDQIEGKTNAIWSIVAPNLSRSTTVGQPPRSLSPNTPTLFVHAPTRAVFPSSDTPSSLRPTPLSPNFTSSYVTSTADERSSAGNEMKVERKHKESNTMSMNLGWS